MIGIFRRPDDEAYRNTAEAELAALRAERATVEAGLEARTQELSVWQQKYQDSAREIDERGAALAAATARAEKAEFEAGQPAAARATVPEPANGRWATGALRRHGQDPVMTGTAEKDRRSEEHTSELQSHHDLVCRLLPEKKKTKTK